MKRKIVYICLTIMAVIAVLAGCMGGQYKNSAFVPKDVLLGKTYETEEKSIGWGEYQTEKDTLGDECIEIHAGKILTTDSKEVFESAVKSFKEKLDVLKSKYAFAYGGEFGDYIYVTIEKAKLGLPTFALLNVDYRHENVILSQLGDLKIEIGKNFTYNLGEDGEFDICVEVPEESREKFENYIIENLGGALYLKLGDITVSSTYITENMAPDSVNFEGLMFVKSDENEGKYEFLLDLAKFVVNDSVSGLYTTNFPITVEDGDEYPVKYVTYMDECVMANVDALYDDVRFERDGVENNIRFIFDIDKSVISDEECIERVIRIYEKCEFDAGAYSQIRFIWPADEYGYMDYIMFTKENGKMVCTGWSEDLSDILEEIATESVE